MTDLLQQDKHYTFEDPKAPSLDGSTTSALAQEWLETIETAREMAISQSISNSYSSDEAFRDLQAATSTSSRTLELDSRSAENGVASSRTTLQKNSPKDDADSFKGRKRFSKRQSKNGLAAVF
jgi:3-phosphoinositide dependent protein kinase-1